MAIGIPSIPDARSSWRRCQYGHICELSLSVEVDKPGNTTRQPADLLAQPRTKWPHAWDLAGQDWRVLSRSNQHTPNARIGCCGSTQPNSPRKCSTSQDHDQGTN